MNKVIARKSIKTKILGIVLFSVFFVTALLGYLSFEFSRNRLVLMLGDSIRGTATSIALFINSADVKIIMSNADKLKERRMADISKPFSDVYSRQPEKSAEFSESGRVYDRYVKLLQDIKKKNRIDSPINIYTVDDGKLKAVLTSEASVIIGTKYSARPEALKAVSTGISQSTGIYTDKDGTWISAYAAAPEVLVEISYKIDSYVKRLRAELFIIILICLTGFVLAAYVSYKLVKKIASGIEKLDEVAVELEEERYATPIDIKSDDEVGHLADTFEMLRQSMRQKIEELRLSLVREKRAHLESIVALTNAVEMRDPYTRQHLYRVQEYALLIAKEMKLSKADIEKLKYSCILHDIGKIYLDKELLQKVKISQKDYEEIKKHSEIGANIVEGIQFLDDVKEAILHHQERWDGKGYPTGLKGKEIPLLARIVMVADAFDAMTTERAYKPKMTLKEAMNELERNAGVQFDPEVCKAFLKYRDDIEKIAKKHFE